MPRAKQCLNGAVVAPHHLAAQAGLEVLREGGNAIEAMIAAAASIPVVYPHMNAIGGDGFWLISEPGADPVAIDACGAAAGLATRDFYADQGFDAIPSRGPLAALTVAGTISGWGAALDLAGKAGGRMPLSRLLAPAVAQARGGIVVTQSQEEAMREKAGELDGVPGYADTYFIDGHRPVVGQVLKQTRLAETLERIAAAGTDDFYRGDLARSMSGDLERLGSPVRLGDLAAHQAQITKPLSLAIKGARLFNLAPPTQGLASLQILGIFDRLGVSQADGFDFVHGLVEATKQSFIVRDAEVTDPAYMRQPAEAFLEPSLIEAMAAKVDRERALPWPHQGEPGDTIWMGAIDGEGRVVSFIQSIYWEFGSGVVLPDTGVLWQNRGTSFQLAEDAFNRLEPGRKPFHTLNPAMARFEDGRVMSYGTMGGDGQPQTQAAIFSRYARFGQDIQDAISAPRWLLGRTWGSQSMSLKLEGRFDPALIEALRAAGHEVDVLEDYTELMGHAGALVRYPSGVIEGGSDPRSDGTVAGY